MFRDLARLIPRLRLAAAHDARRLQIEDDQVLTGIEQCRIELDRLLELGLRAAREEGLSYDARVRYLHTDRATQPEVIERHLRLRGDRLLERLLCLPCFVELQLPPPFLEGGAAGLRAKRAWRDSDHERRRTRADGAHRDSEQTFPHHSVRSVSASSLRNFR